jgi:hypothetical protein
LVSAVHHGRTIMNHRSFASLAVLVAATGIAHAQPPGDAPAPASDSRPDPVVAITVSPIHLIIPMAEVTAEVRLAPKVGIAVIGGVGMIRSAITNERIDLLEAGASLRYYATGSFRGGVQVGAEALYVYASTGDMSVDVKARGLGLSPFIGYKWTHSSGFTLEGQLGASYMVARAKSSTATVEDSRIGPMLNLNAGWSL